MDARSHCHRFCLEHWEKTRARRPSWSTVIWMCNRLSCLMDGILILSNSSKKTENFTVSQFLKNISKFVCFRTWLDGRQRTSYWLDQRYWGFASTEGWNSDQHQVCFGGYGRERIGRIGRNFTRTQRQFFGRCWHDLHLGQLCKCFSS